MNGVEFKAISQGRNSHELVGVSSNRLILLEVAGEKVVSEVKINEDVTELQSNQHFIVVGTIKGKVHFFNY